MFSSKNTLCSSTLDVASFNWCTITVNIRLLGCVHHTRLIIFFDHPIPFLIFFRSLLPIFQTHLHLLSLQTFFSEQPLSRLWSINIQYFSDCRRWLIFRSLLFFDRLKTNFIKLNKSRNNYMPRFLIKRLKWDRNFCDFIYGFHLCSVTARIFLSHNHIWIFFLIFHDIKLHTLQIKMRNLKTSRAAFNRWKTVSISIHFYKKITVFLCLRRKILYF